MIISVIQRRTWRCLSYEYGHDGVLWIPSAYSAPFRQLHFCPLHSPRPSLAGANITAAARAASPAITRLGPSFTSHLPRLDAAPSESSTEARIPSSSPPVGVRIIRRGRPSLSAARLTGDSPHGEALLAAACRRSPRPESFTCRGLPSLAAGPRLASESLAGRTGIRPSRVSRRGGRRVTHRSPTHSTAAGLPPVQSFWLAVSPRP